MVSAAVFTLALTLLDEVQDLREQLAAPSTVELQAECQYISTNGQGQESNASTALTLRRTAAGVSCFLGVAEDATLLHDGALVDVTALVIEVLDGAAAYVPVADDAVAAAAADEAADLTIDKGVALDQPRRHLVIEIDSLVGRHLESYAGCVPHTSDPILAEDVRAVGKGGARLATRVEAAAIDRLVRQVCQCVELKHIVDAILEVAST